MKTLHLMLLVTLTGLSGPEAAAGLFDARSASLAPRIFRPVTDAETVFRAQSSGSVPIPPGAQTGPNSTGAATGNGNITFDSPGTPSLPNSSTWNAFSPPIGADPFVTDPAYGGAAPYAPYTPYGPGMTGSPYGSPYGNPYSTIPGQPFSTPGTYGPTPYQQGWHSRLDLEWMPAVGITPSGMGKFEQFGVNFDVANSGPFMPGWMFTWTNQFRLRNWDGPNGTMPGPGLPGKAFHFGVDLELETPNAGPMSVSFGLNPSLNTDFEGSVGSDAWQLDGRGMFIFQLDPAWSLVLGAGYWDRVDGLVIPYAGFIYRDDFWEWRVMFPETTVSLFLGNGARGASWMYIRAEYHVEAYEVSTTTGRDEVQLEDYRAVLGLRSDNGMSSTFIEGGWVFDRNVSYKNPGNASFDPSTGFFARLGWRY